MDRDRIRIALEHIRDEAGSHTVALNSKTGYSKIYDLAVEALDAPEPVGSTVGEKMCKWCDETKPLIPMVSGNIIPMICSECGTHVEDWDWKILRAEMKKLRSAPEPACMYFEPKN